MSGKSEMKVKFCGLTRPEDIQAANVLKPDFIGFVFVPKSKRYISPKQASLLKEKLDPEILSAGVFVNEEIDTIAEIVKEGVIDIIQLHGSEDEAYIRFLRSKIPDIPVWKAFSITCREDLIQAFDSSADCILLDAKNPGSGKSFDWSMIEEVLKHHPEADRPYILAGGLNPERIEPALQCLKDHPPYALDVSSGIETEGRKDPALMKKFMERLGDALKDQQT